MKRFICFFLMILVINLVGCGPKSNAEPTKISERREVTERENVVDKIKALSQKVDLEILLLPELDDMGYKQIEVKGDTIRFSYKDWTFVESKRDQKLEEIVTGKVTQEKYVKLGNGLSAKLMEVSNINGNQAELTCLSFKSYRTNVTILAGPQNTINEEEIESIAQTLEPILVFPEESDKKVFQGNYFKSNKLKRGNQFNVLNGSKIEIEEEQTLVVEAGWLATQPDQGTIGVMTINKAGQVISQKIYNTSVKHGPIMITINNAFNFTIMAADGYQWIFNPFDGYREITQN